MERDPAVSQAVSVTVETEDAKNAKMKWEIIPGQVKVPKRPDAPWRCLYPVVWLQSATVSAKTWG